MCQAAQCNPTHDKCVSLALATDKSASLAALPMWHYHGVPSPVPVWCKTVAPYYTPICRFFDHPPEQQGCVVAVMSATFRNNSTSRWERAMEPWPVELRLSDPINPIFKTARTRWVA